MENEQKNPDNGGNSKHWGASDVSGKLKNSLRDTKGAVGGALHRLGESPGNVALVISIIAILLFLGIVLPGFYPAFRTLEQRVGSLQSTMDQTISRVDRLVEERAARELAAIEFMKASLKGMTKGRSATVSSQAEQLGLALDNLSRALQAEQSGTVQPTQPAAPAQAQ